MTQFCGFVGNFYSRILLRFLVSILLLANNRVVRQCLNFNCCAKSSRVRSDNEYELMSANYNASTNFSCNYTANSPMSISKFDNCRNSNVVNGNQSEPTMTKTSIGATSKLNKKHLAHSQFFGGVIGVGTPLAHVPLRNGCKFARNPITMSYEIRFILSKFGLSTRTALYFSSVMLYISQETNVNLLWVANHTSELPATYCSETGNNLRADSSNPILVCETSALPSGVAGMTSFKLSRYPIRKCPFEIAVQLKPELRVISHEILHILGFGHEHQASDVTEYLNADCIHKSEGTRMSVKLQNSQGKQMSAPVLSFFDFHSVMFLRKKFDKCLLKNYRSLTSRTRTSLPSSCDVQAINLLYPGPKPSVPCYRVKASSYQSSNKGQPDLKSSNQISCSS